jgi:hypothetical protein
MALVPTALGCLLALGGCQNNSGDTGQTGGPITGAADTHCQGTGGLMAQATNQAACHATIDMSGPQPDMAGSGGGSDYGDTLYNAEGNDDDCKYHVKFTVTPVRKSSQVTFTVTATNLVTNQPVTGADISPEVFLSDTHPAPNSGSSTTESPPGTYTVGPILFDASGMWTVRFHFFENCTDALPDSPHGHAAFYINVP